MTPDLITHHRDMAAHFRHRLQLAKCCTSENKKYYEDQIAFHERAVICLQELAASRLPKSVINEALREVEE